MPRKQHVNAVERLGWVPGSLLITSRRGGAPRPLTGLVNANGLGMHVSPRGMGWNLTHLNTGLRICSLQTGDLVLAASVATAIGYMADWGFLGVDGWKNMDPDLPRRLRALLKTHGLRDTVAGDEARNLQPAELGTIAEIQRRRGV